MPIVSAQDILQAGWPPGPGLKPMMEFVKSLERRGVHDPDYAMKLLRRKFPPPPQRIPWRTEPAPLAEAIAPAGPGDEENIGNVRRLMRELLRSPVIERGALMPDACPAGNAPATIPVGGAIAVRNAIIPSAHSADICCSVQATFFRSDRSTSEMLDALMSVTRFGIGGRPPHEQVHHPVLEEPVWENPFLRGLERHAAMHMADQGDGNHFAWLGRLSLTPAALRTFADSGYRDLASGLTDSGGRHEWLVLVTHHGSRGLGANVYRRGQKAALEHTAQAAENVPAAAAWLPVGTPEGDAYWEALQYVSRWTFANHHSIHDRFLAKIGAAATATLGNEHNFVWKRGDLYLHGKGATPAWRDASGRPLPGLIPLNMASPVLLVLGADNDEFLSFAPHGAGRNISRTALLRNWRDRGGNLDEAAVGRAVREQTSGLDIRWFAGKPDLSESPLGYKPAAQVIEQIRQFGLADVVAEIQPLGCIMAGDQGPAPWMRRRDELTPKQKRQIEHRADRRKVHQRLRHAAEPDNHEDENDFPA